MSWRDRSYFTTVRGREKRKRRRRAPSPYQIVQTTTPMHVQLGRDVTEDFLARGADALEGRFEAWNIWWVFDGARLLIVKERRTTEVQIASARRLTPPPRRSRDAHLRNHQP